ncbi:MAG: hypothetical protein IPF72_14170 [Chitinophagaceae bacterium]|nr:hypothetical protein [Chitinophagaceae bacterium]
MHRLIFQSGAFILLNSFPVSIFICSFSKGMLIPRVSLTGITDVATIVAPATSLLIYNTNAAIAGGSGAGYYYYSGTQWVKIIDAVTPGNSWSLTGNSGTTAGINFIGTTDSVSLVFKVNNNNAGKIDVTLKNAGFGEKTLLANTTGTGNTAVGFQSLLTNTAGNGNTAAGYQSMYKNTADGNTAFGYQSLYENGSVPYNSAFGYQALYQNTGGDNSAMGYAALSANTGGSFNTAMGTFALTLNQLGSKIPPSGPVQ